MKLDIYTKILGNKEMVKIRKNGSSYIIKADGNYICAISEKKIKDNYEDFLEDPCNPDGLLEYIKEKMKKMYNDKTYFLNKLEENLEELVEKLSELFGNVCENNDNK